MNIKKKVINAKGVKFFIKESGKEVGRAYLYILKNDLHSEPFGLLEDVFVCEGVRKRGIGTHLIKTVIKEANKKNCYKLIATSRYLRPKVHKLYKKFNFKDYGIEFRKNLKK